MWRRISCSRSVKLAMRAGLVCPAEEERKHCMLRFTDHGNYRILFQQHTQSRAHQRLIVDKHKR